MSGRGHYYPQSGGGSSSQGGGGSSGGRGQQEDPAEDDYDDYGDSDRNTFDDSDSLATTAVEGTGLSSRASMTTLVPEPQICTACYKYWMLCGNPVRRNNQLVSCRNQVAEMFQSCPRRCPEHLMRQGEDLVHPSARCTDCMAPFLQDGPIDPDDDGDGGGGGGGNSKKKRNKLRKPRKEDDSSKGGSSSHRRHRREGKAY